MTGMTVLIVDDHPLLRRGVRQLLEPEGDIDAIIEAGNGADALEQAQRHRPDLILLDCNMVDMDGVATLDALRSAGVNARIIMLTVSNHEDDVVAALRHGADGYLLKDMEPEDLVHQLRRAVDGQLVISDALTAVLARALGRERDQGEPGIAHLTNREREILQLLANGLSNKMIGRRLDITEATTKVHVKNLLRKLGLRSRVEAAVWAVNQGLR